MRTQRIKAVEYLRVSTEEQAASDRTGLQRQKETNQLSVNKYNLEIVKTITLKDVSGASVMYTPEINELMSLISSNEIQGIVVAEYDRLFRPDNFRDFSLLAYLVETDTKIYLPDRPIDIRTESGFLDAGFQAIFSGLELSRIKNRMIKGKEIKRKNGEHPNGLQTLPQGVSYNYEKKEFLYTPGISKIKRLFSLFHDQGIHNFRELERLTGIHHRTISNLLRNELYIGYRIYDQKRSHVRRIKNDGRQADRKKVKRDAAEIIRLKVINKSAISKTVFYNAQEILDKKNKEFHRKKTPEGERFLYSGFLRCAHCDNKLYSSSGGRNHKKDYYFCKTKTSLYKKNNTEINCKSGYLPKEQVESTVTSFVIKKFRDRKFLNLLLKETMSQRGEKDITAEIKSLERKIKNNEKKKTQILKLYTDGLYSLEEIEKEAGEINLRIDKYKKNLEKLNKEWQPFVTINNEARRSNLRNDSYKERLEKLFLGEPAAESLKCIKNQAALLRVLKEFEFWPPQQKRRLMRSQLPEIFIDKSGIKRVTINFYNLRNRTGMGSWLPPA